jgi:hypothetical protein
MKWETAAVHRYTPDFLPDLRQRHRLGFIDTPASAITKMTANH